MSTGNSTVRTNAKRREDSPRRRRARRTRWPLSTSCGATVKATVTATPASWSADGTAFSKRFGSARTLAAPTQINSVARRSPSYAAPSTPSADTGPPMRMPCTNRGNGSCGNVNNVWAPYWPSSRTRKATRTPITIRPRTRYVLNPRAQGASPRRAATTCATTTTINASSRGFVVRLAAVAIPSAHSHHAPGCSARATRTEGCRRACISQILTVHLPRG